MFRVSGGESGFDAESITEACEQLAAAAGRYGVDEIRAEPLPSGHTSRRWCHLIRHPDGRIAEEPHPWPGPGDGGVRRFGMR